MRYWLFGLFFTLLFCACQPAESVSTTPEASSAAPKSSVASSKMVSQKDIEERLPFLSPQDRAFASTPIGRQNLLQVIAREKLIALAAQEEGLTKHPDYLTLLTEKRAKLDKIYQDYAAQTLETLWYERHRQNGALTITEEEINDYHQKYPYEMTIRQIIVDNAETADQLLRSLKGSPARWNELSRQYNKAPESMQGEIAFMPGEFLPDIEAIAANSAVGSVQGFFKTAYGFHIIKKTGEKRLSLSEATPRIQAVLENRKLDGLLKNLQNKYEVIIYDKDE